MNIEKLFEMQEDLDKKILDNNFVTDIKPKDLLSERLLALHTEVSELANATRSFKYWSSKESEPEEVILDEYVDVLHFWLSVGLALGVTPAQVELAYMKKHMENHLRQEEGY